MPNNSAVNRLRRVTDSLDSAVELTRQCRDYFLVSANQPSPKRLYNLASDLISTCETCQWDRDWEERLTLASSSLGHTPRIGVDSENHFFDVAGHYCSCMLSNFWGLAANCYVGTLASDVHVALFNPAEFWKESLAEQARSLTTCDPLKVLLEEPERAKTRLGVFAKNFNRQFKADYEYSYICNRIRKVSSRAIVDLKKQARTIVQIDQYTEDSRRYNNTNLFSFQPSTVAPVASPDDGSNVNKQTPSHTAGEKQTSATGKAKILLPAAFTLWHQYQDGSILKFDPVGCRKLARMARVSPALASGFFKEHFGDHEAYKQACHNEQKLMQVLRKINGEASQGRTVPLDRVPEPIV